MAKPTLTVGHLIPHEQQKRFIYSDAEQVMVRAGRRGGKTTGLAIKARNEFMKGRRVLYISPTARQTEAFWDAILKELGVLLHHNMLWVQNKAKVIRWVDRSKEGRITAETSFKPDHMRGTWCHELILDEYQHQHPEVWSRVVQPFLFDEGGNVTFLFTPPSPYSRLEIGGDKMHASTLFNEKQGEEGWETITFPSWDNPHLKGEIERARKNMTEEEFRAEVGAEDVDLFNLQLWRDHDIVHGVPPAKEEFDRIVIGVDPSGTVKGDETGIIVVGRMGRTKLWVLADYSMHGVRPEAWAKRVATAYHKWGAKLVVVEDNKGGDMTTAVLKQQNRRMRVKQVTARENKSLRAEPVAVMYQRGKVFHAANSGLAKLEQQMLTWTPVSNKSPDRIDALVWAVAELAKGKLRIPREHLEWRG